jgi:outer membrane protein TolC
VRGRTVPRRRGLTLGVALALAAAPPLAAQERPAAVRQLSLEEALARAEATSEDLVIAEAGLLSARGERLRAESEYYPRVTGAADYTRTVASEFSGLGGGAGGTPPAPPCTPFLPDTTLPLPVRVDSLERAVACLSAGGATTPDLSQLFGGGQFPFGNPNRYDLNVVLSQALYTGGRRGAQRRIAEADSSVARLELRATRAQVVLDATRAYFDAALAARLVEIAREALAQAEQALAVTRVAVAGGEQAEFDALRARVARDNAQAVVIQRQAERDIAFARLRTLLDLPGAEPIELTTPLDAEPQPAVARRAPDVPGPDTAAALRPPVREAVEAVAIEEARLRIARAQRLPEVSITAQYGRVALPNTTIPSLDDFRPTFWFGVSARVPIFTGGQIRGDEYVAQAAVREARARLDRVRELAVQDARTILALLEAAHAAWVASTGTVEEAERAYAIAELRYQQGVSSLLELADTRVMLEEARGNRARAARDLQVARTRAALLPDLPLQTADPGLEFAIPAALQIAPQQPTATTPATILPAQTAIPGQRTTIPRTRDPRITGTPGSGRRP